MADYPKVSPINQGMAVEWWPNRLAESVSADTIRDLKSRPVLTRSHYMWRHEPCAYGWPKGHLPRKPSSGQHTIWEVNQQGESDGIHPTQKPVELCRRPILSHTDLDGLCYEPFSGSGTMLAAAHLTGRRCYAMEISPAFVDVAVTRWEGLSGKKAELCRE